MNDELKDEARTLLQRVELREREIRDSIHTKLRGPWTDVAPLLRKLLALDLDVVMCPECTEEHCNE